MAARAFKGKLASGSAQRISNILKTFSIRPVKRIQYSFDPYTENVRSIREMITLLNSKDVLRTSTARSKIDVQSDGSKPKMDIEFELSCASAYASLKKVCDECDLKAPCRVTSVSMRKYTATLTQMMNLDKNELEWVCRHLGHSVDVHKTHYRQMSGLVERVFVSKLLMVQDLKMTERFKGKNLAEIDVSDILDQTSGGCSDEDDTVTANTVAQYEYREDDANDLLEDEDIVFQPVDSDGEENDTESPKRVAKKPMKQRQRWTETEMSEISNYLRSYLDSGIVPRTVAVEKAKEKSKARNGQLWKRSNPLIVKKISALNHKK